ncbi:hypothetical protein FISHEDRAFT_65614 [Fistulina hepatica ATCC 64428]|uniref:protein-tyrosine-phosphatase n=1 Tax=Fistulina hepatica ATCC 64428 TaxID=1128425 RepID=A0A0D7AD38_9AGAR|nr:hypothetical protein FISHEDRAFT_65614 [Fistulina hepatica ATCC 64428]
MTSNLDEIIPNLWVGNLPSAMDVDTLKQNHIYSVLTAMSGRIQINETFVRHQIQLDDDPSADILVHFLPCISFIQAELDKDRGVLVHCQAGMSRSVAIVAAYLMYTRGLEPDAALEMIRQKRPLAGPNTGFYDQLRVFREASFAPSRKSKVARQFYLKRTTEEVMNGDGSMPETDMFAKFPATPTETPGDGNKGPRRRIRCKMCRQELAAREHMMDHGQLGPETPASLTPATSRRPSTNQSLQMSSVGPSARSIRSRHSGSLSQGLSGLQMTLADGGDATSDVLNSADSALDDEDEDDDAAGTVDVEHLRLVASQLGRRMSDAVKASRASAVTNPDVVTLQASDKDVAPVPGNIDAKASVPPPTTYFSPSDLAAQLYDNPKIRALRGPAGGGPSSTQPRPVPPILVNPKCSGYFVEPMKWMEPMLESGELSGKIICPNKKCGVKLGNFDWAGVRCGCKEWVVPGFCINRSKVDEIVI